MHSIENECNKTKTIKRNQCSKESRKSVKTKYIQSVYFVNGAMKETK